MSSESTVREEGEEEAAAFGCVCVCVYAQDTPLRSALVATGCRRRRAEKRSSSVCFDRQMRFASTGRHLYGNLHSTGRKHANVEEEPEAEVEVESKRKERPLFGAQ